MSKPPYTDAEFEVIKGPDQPFSTETVDDEAWDWAAGGRLLVQLFMAACAIGLFALYKFFLEGPFSDAYDRLFGG